MKANRGVGGVAILGLVLVLCPLSVLGQAPGWRSVTAGYLSRGDLGGAAGDLQGRFERLEAVDKPEACVLLAFLHDRLGEKDKARGWLVSFFETYGNPNVAFPYLGIAAGAEVEAYINSWRSRFPHCSSVSIVWPKKNPGPLPPQVLQLGLDMTNDAYYRFSGAEGILGGGMLHKGFNILSLDAWGFFDRSGSRAFTLDLKAGDIVLRTEVILSVGMTPEAEPPAEEQLAKTKGLIYELSVYVGSRLVVKSSKTDRASEPLKLNIKPVNLVANPLFKPPGEHDPFDPNQMGVPIPEALGIIAGVIKDLVTKKTPKTESSIEKATVVQFTFFRPGPAETETEVKVSVSIQTRSLASAR